jgi:hypothetical protein
LRLPANQGICESIVIEKRGHSQWAEPTQKPEDRLSAIKPKKKRKKRNALVVCSDRKQFWTTQTQFWQWVREGIVIKSHDSPLTGSFVRDHEETAVVISNTVLNLAYPNHLREALVSRRMGFLRK